MRRTDIPARITGATDNTLARWQDLFAVLLAHAHLWEVVRSDALLVKTEGRPRMAGEWALPYLAFVNSAERELTRWYRTVPPELWQQAGFVQVPSYHATYKNFNAFEEHEEAFRTVAAKLVQLAVKESGGKVGHAVHVDGTEAEAHSRLIHDCTGEELQTCQKHIASPARSSNGEARSERHQLATAAPTDDPLLGAADDLTADERGLRVLVNGCWYSLSDRQAGIRAYTKDGKLRKFWAGYYCAKAVDHYTGGVLAVHVTSASVQEHLAYPDLYAQIKTNLGRAPLAVVADRGYSVSSVFELNTREGVASVIPWRAHWREPVRTDHLPRYDRHGIPHCQECGGESAFVRFHHATGSNAEPRLWFQCARPQTPGCEGTKSVLCKEDWRLLVPLWCTTPAYQVLRASHDNYEAAHHRWRERYAVAGDTKADRPKRRGIGVQQLRASAALVVEWLTICHRQGWLGGAVLNDRPEVTLSREEAARYTRRLLRERHALGLGTVAADEILAHQAEVAAAYKTPSQFGPASAYGSEVTFDAEAAIVGVDWQQAEPEDEPPE